MKKKQSYGVRQISHWQGRTPSPVCATFPLTPEGEKRAEALRERLSTCSLCTPSSGLGNEQGGQCYEVVPSWREPGYVSDDLSYREELAIYGA